MSEAQATNSNYSCIKEDPVSLLNLVDKHVKIYIIKDYSFEGYVHSFDPVTYSIILLVAEGDTFKPTLIPGHAILNISETPSITDIKPTRKATVDSDEDIIAKKSKLIAWFKSNLLPVTELDDKIVLGNVTVLPPYNITDVCTDNPIVALRIKQIMERRPND